MFGTFLHHKLQYISSYFVVLYNISKISFLCRNPFKNHNFHFHFHFQWTLGYWRAKLILWTSKWRMSKISGIINEMHERTFYKERQINKRCTNRPYCILDNCNAFWSVRAPKKDNFFVKIISFLFLLWEFLLWGLLWKPHAFPKCFAKSLNAISSISWINKRKRFH